LIEYKILKVHCSVLRRWFSVLRCVHLDDVPPFHWCCNDWWGGLLLWAGSLLWCRPTGACCPKCCTVA